MKSSVINSRELSKETARVLRELPKSGPQVITRGGQVAGILIPPSGEGIEADIDIVSRLRLAQALAASQAEAVRKGTDRLSMAEIDKEVAATRRRKRK